MPLHFDLHCHSHYSGDAVSSPEELVAAARAAGLHGFALTDHNTCDGIHHMLDRGLMREDGLPVDGLLVIPAVEVTTADGHLLCIGAVLPPLKGAPAREVVEIAHAHGALAIPPHPYDLFRAGIREAVLDRLPIDALEVFNAATTFKRYNRRALAYAEARGLPMTAGSDAHHAAALGTAFTALETDDFTLRGVLAQIVRPNTLTQRYMRAVHSVRKTWNNLLRLRPRRIHDTP